MALDRSKLEYPAPDAPPSQNTPRLPTSGRFEIRNSVFWPAAIVILVFIAFGVAFTDQVADAFSAVQGAITSTMGWFYMAAVTFFLVFVIWLALSRHGNKRLGPDDSRPEYGYLSWFSMLFSAGMGIGLLFFSVAEPISHFGITLPPTAEASETGTIEAARDAMTTSFFHWGLHAWAIYIVVGLALGFYAYRQGLPLTLRSAFYPLLGNRVFGPIGDAIDVLAIVGTLFGVATSLGFGVIQISSGLEFAFGMSGGQGLQLALIAIITAVAIGSVVLGLDRGIRRLSIANVGLGGVLLAFVLVAGPTVLILNALVANTGNYLQALPNMSFSTKWASDHSWEASWTLFYWGWWVSWAPFVGMFIARISFGRSIREFVAVVLGVPTIVTFLVLTVFGQTAINMELTGNAGILAAAEEQLPFALFALLEQFPLAALTSGLAIVVIATFFITSSDSGSLVDDMHASGGDVEPHSATRVFWGLMEGVVAAVLLVAGGQTGLTAFQNASVATGIPLGILYVLICFGLVRALRRDQGVMSYDEPGKGLEEPEPEEGSAAEAERETAPSGNGRARQPMR